MSGSIGIFVGLLLVGLASSSKFDELFQPSWALDHFSYEGDSLKLKLDNFSGKFIPFNFTRVCVFVLFFIFLCIIIYPKLGFLLGMLYL